MRLVKIAITDEQEKQEKATKTKLKGVAKAGRWLPRACLCTLTRLGSEQAEARRSHATRSGLSVVTREAEEGGEEEVEQGKRERATHATAVTTADVYSRSKQEIKCIATMTTRVLFTELRTLSVDTGGDGTVKACLTCHPRGCIRAPVTANMDSAARVRECAQRMRQ